MIFAHDRVIVCVCVCFGRVDGKTRFFFKFVFLNIFTGSRARFRRAPCVVSEDGFAKTSRPADETGGDRGRTRAARPVHAEKRSELIDVPRKKRYTGGTRARIDYRRRPMP